MSASPRISTAPFCRTASGDCPASAIRLNGLPLTSASATAAASCVTCRREPLERTTIRVTPRTSTARILPSSSLHSCRARGERGSPRLSTFSMVVSTMASIAIAAMHGDDAAGEIVVLAPLEAGRTHQGEAFLRVGMFADGFGKIAVAAGIRGDQAAEQRQHVEGIRVIQGLQGSQGRMGKFENEELPSGLQGAHHGRKRGRLVGDVAQTEADGDAIEVTGGKRQPLGIGLHAGDIAHRAIVEKTVAPTL